MDSLKGQNLMKSDGSSVPADSALWRLCLYPLSDHQKTCNPTWRSLMVTGLLWNTILLLPMIWSRNMVRKICQAIHDKQIIFCSGISGIPSLVVVKLDGTVVTKDGRSHVTGKVPAQAVKDDQCRVLTNDSILYCLSSQHWYHIFIRILCIFDSTLWRLCLYPLSYMGQVCDPLPCPSCQWPPGECRWSPAAALSAAQEPQFYPFSTLPISYIVVMYELMKWDYSII